ncbi:MAG: formylmethanofuran dehydrogenase subunit C [Theionarchaea archaeon]|nr:formylmethanofuran dehydrogenase subunit C [Theionarchaea archaeon]MBU7034377.1 formylmethanofuran dehydrogenase subunit C [Theionarchaea archaeon]MBU7040059.1 formylmethanofuran dehydrogenase subunit C [Theionarchaea archaeon]
MFLNPLLKTAIPVTAPCIAPDCFSGKSVKEIKALTVYYGNKEKHLQDLFDIKDDGQDVITLGSVPTVKYIGKGMTAGSIVVKGDAGMHLGAEMKGGRITVEGSVSDWAGAEMKGGEIFIAGNAGHCLGGAYRGSKSGMNKGLIVVKGNAGTEVGGLMKKGIIVVEGTLGDAAGCNMKGGTLICYGRPGDRLGAFMQRGSIVLYESPYLLPTFTYNAVYNPTWLRVFLRELAKTPYKIPITQGHIEGAYRRYNGDISELGKGEILVFQG